MKRWFLITALLCITLIGFYFFILPSSKKVSYAVNVSCAAQAATRFIISGNWNKWWPGTIIDKSSFSYKEFNYKIDEILLNGFRATISHNDDSLKAFIQIEPVENDSAQFIWTGNYSFSKNPVERIKEYTALKNAGNNIISLLDTMSAYFNNPENIYGDTILLKKIQETFLVSTSKTFLHYPGITEIYPVIDSLKSYISYNKGSETNYPMINVHTDDSLTYELMVAIATNNALASSGPYNFKRLAMGKILEMKVNGGPATIQNAQVQLKNYVDDHNKVSPAIPYQLLVTDRLKQPDTSKWVTQLYYPVF